MQNAGVKGGINRPGQPADEQAASPRNFFDLRFAIRGALFFYAGIYWAVTLFT
jgi:hypothetical protein